MKTIQFIFKELFYGGHILSLGAFSISVSTILLYNLKLDLLQIAPIYFITQSIYYLDRYIGIRVDKKTNRERSIHLQSYYRYIPLIILFYIIFVLFITLQTKPQYLLINILIVSIGLIYGKYLKNLTKYIIGFKNLIVSTIWIFPIIYAFLVNNINILSIKSILFGFFIYLRSLEMQIFFDLKDKAMDKKFGLLTIPNLLDKKEIYLLLITISYISIFPIIYGISIQSISIYSILLLTLPIIDLIIFDKIKNKLEYYLILIKSCEYFYILLVILLANTLDGI